MTHAAARRILRERAAALGSQQALADELGVTKAWISMLIGGQSRPGRRLANTIAQRYSIPASAWDTERAA